MFNRIKKSQIYPSIFQPSTITSIWKRKGEQSNLDNDRGIFNVTKIRSILDKLLYNDIYDTVDSTMSSSNIGARKSRNIRDHLFVINAILNETTNSADKPILDLQIYDVSKCFDKLEYVNTSNDLFSAGVKSDKFILIGNSNKACNVSVKLPWGSLSKPIHFENIEMQGTVLAPLKCSLSIDKIGKYALDQMHTELYKYKKCVTIPPLAMIDDILAVTECSLKSVRVNAMIESHVNSMQLKMGEKKCFHMHIGKDKHKCRPLQVNNSVVNTLSKETYLGSIITSDGKIDQHILDRQNKGIGIVNQILSLLKEVHFGQYYFEMVILFRNTMLINGMLFSIESVHGLKDKHIDQLASCDKYLLRKAFDALSTTATESFYLETGILPVKYAIIARRLMYFWTILNKPDSELVKQVYSAQKIAPYKNDWILQIKDDLDMCNIELTETEIAKMKKEKFKVLVKNSVRELAREHLLNIKTLTPSPGVSMKILLCKPIFKVKCYPYKRNNYFSNFVPIPIIVKQTSRTSIRITYCAIFVTWKITKSISLTVAL